jgi:hypothetical protein
MVPLSAVAEINRVFNSPHTVLRTSPQAAEAMSVSDALALDSTPRVAVMVGCAVW